MEKKSGAKFLLIVITIVVISALITVGFLFWKNQNTGAPAVPTPSVTKTQSNTSASPKISSSPVPSQSPTISSSISPTKSAVPASYKVPSGETFVIAARADTNGDTKEEILVTTKLANGKYHIYILSADGTQTLFDNKEFIQPPVRIATQRYSENDNFLSWMLIFVENSGNFAFIHFNGTKYEIPTAESGI